MTYGGFKDLARRTAADKVLRDKAFNIANVLKYEGYQRGLASMVVVLIIKLNKITVLWTWLFNNQELQLKKFINPSLETFKKIKVYSKFKDNIWGVDLADVQLIKI